MSVCYSKLWNLLDEKNMKKYELQRKSGISGNIIVRLTKEEYVSVQSLEKICKTLKCSIDDIMEFRDDV